MNDKSDPLSELVPGFVCGVAVDWFIVRPEDGLPSEVVLNHVVSSGAGVAIVNRAGPSADLSLSFLAPIISRLRSLSVRSTDRLLDADILLSADSLRLLELSAKPTKELRLDKLPNLYAFEGQITSKISSLTRNPNLARVRISGTIPRSSRSFEGAIAQYWQEGGRADIELPQFVHPEALTEIVREGPRGFDLAHLRDFPNLTHLRLTGCPNVVGVSVIDQLPLLNDLQVLACATPEDWERVTRPESVMLREVEPPLSRHFSEIALSRGWSVSPPAVPRRGVWVDDAGDHSLWGVFQESFTELDEAVARWDDRGPANGLDAETLIMAVVGTMRGQGTQLDPQPDSESAFAAVYFPSRSQAEMVADQVNETLSSGTEALTALLSHR